MIASGYSTTSPTGELERELSSGVQRRIGTVIRAYEEQGFHRTGTAVDQASRDWLANEVRQIGLEPALEEYSLSRVDPVASSFVVNDRKIEGLPLFDGAFTSSAGIAGSLGNLDGDDRMIELLG